MKKLGLYTARGVVSEADTEAGNPQKISLFDGRFDTAYRITNFKIWASTYTGSSDPDCIGKLSKNSIGTTAAANFMRADDDNQIAWAASAGSADGGLGFGEGPVIDRDNMVVEDLYVYARTTGTNTSPINYLVEMEKYEITESEGALLMARDRADGE
jgi:hypothetical protein